MGRSRRRNRHGVPQMGESAPVETIVSITPVETLSPTYVPMLAFDGMEPWDEVPAAPVALEDDPGPSLDVLPDSIDPSQLVLAPGHEENQDGLEGLEEEEGTVAEILVEEPVAEVEVERPILVLESEPPVEVQAELELAVAPAPAIDEEPAIAESYAPEVVAALEPVVDPIELRVADARAAADEGRTIDARNIYREIIAQRPNHLIARNALAQLLERGGDSQGALVEYDRALEMDGEHATLLTNRGALLGAMGRYAAAERDLKKVLRTDVNHVDALYHLGVVMTRKGLWAEAVTQLRRVAEIDPTRGVAYFYLGEALNKVDDLYGAMAAYQRAAELVPTHARALYGLGIVYDRLGRPDDAARMYRRSREAGTR